MTNHHIDEVSATRALKFIADILRTLQSMPYQIALLDDPTPEDTRASVAVQPGYLVAELGLCAHWDELDSEQQMNALLHETMHIILQPMYNVYAALVNSDYIPPAMRDYAGEHFTQANETVCEQMASAMTEWIKVKDGWDSALKYAKAKKAKSSKVSK